MTASALLKKVRETYPEIFEELPAPKLKLVKKAIIYASKLGAEEEVLTTEEHEKVLRDLTGKAELSSGNRLKAYRLRKDLSQVELARRSGIPQANISAMESGKRSIGVQIAKRLARVLGCGFRQLV
jgi:DNA-binding XRE family transcriptional regulator